MSTLNSSFSVRSSDAYARKSSTTGRFSTTIEWWTMNEFNVGNNFFVPLKTNEMFYEDN